jgi:hypothetical protein
MAILLRRYNIYCAQFEEVTTVTGTPAVTTIVAKSGGTISNVINVLTAGPPVWQSTLHTVLSVLCLHSF